MLHSAFNRSTLGNSCTIMIPFCQAGTLRHRGEMTRPRSQGWGRTGLESCCPGSQSCVQESSSRGQTELHCFPGKRNQSSKDRNKETGFYFFGNVAGVRNSYGREINSWEETKMCFQQLFIVLSNCKGVNRSKAFIPQQIMGISKTHKYYLGTRVPPGILKHTLLLTVKLYKYQCCFKTAWQATIPFYLTDLIKLMKIDYIR